MATTLLVPGFDGGGKGHWMSWFETVLPDTQRVAQQDYKSTDLSDWAASVRWQLSKAIDPVWIVAHGFGCLAAVRAAFDMPDRVEGALLVAPFDPDNLRLAWLMPEEPLRFPTMVAASTNDPYMRLSKAAFWAGFWSSGFSTLGRVGSVDAAAGFGPWPNGLALFDELRRSPAAHLQGAVAGEAARITRAI
jgi:predicted alpha/beta hydrolase family esterase